MKVAGLLLLVLALSWAPRPPTRGPKAFLERLNLSNQDPDPEVLSQVPHVPAGRGEARLGPGHPHQGALS